MFDTLPDGLGETAPGPELAAALASVDVSRVSGHDRVIVLRACERLRAHYAARSCQAMAAISDAIHADAEGDDTPGNDYAAWEDAAAAEIRVALRWTRRTAERELGFAHLLWERIPHAHRALLAGRIDLHRARILVLDTIHLSEGTAREVVDSVLHRAAGWTTTQLKHQLRRLCITADPADAQRRYDTALAERRVASEPHPDGTASIYGTDLPPDAVAAAMRHVNHLARSLKGAGDPRPMDQLRADVFVGLLQGHGTPDGGRGTIDLRVDVATLLGLAQHPADLGGYGPILADLARQLVHRNPDLEWRYGITDPDTGRLLRTGTTRRRPTTSQRRTVEMRDLTCIFPGCIAPATTCDLDHIHPWSHGGPTHPANLGPKCEPDHTTRHTAGWTYHPHGDDDYLWTTKLGHRYTTSGQSP